MSRAVQAVFLVDIASLHSYDDNLIAPDFEKSVRAIRYCCLKFLTYFGTRKMRWGCKFCCSNGLARQRMEKRPFSEHNLENFEDFEDALTQRFERYRAACKAVDRTSATSRDPPCAVIRTALTQVASEFQWDAPDIASPVKTAKRRRLDASEDAVTNYVFCISRPPVSYRDLDIFLGKQHQDADIVAELMPAELRRLFLVTLNVRLIWIDTASLTSPTPQPSDFKLAIEKLNGTVMPIHLTETLSGAFKANPFSSIAEFYVEKSARKTLPGTTAVIRGDTTLCRAALCFDSATSDPSLQSCWKEIHITYETPKACVVNSERVLGFRADASEETLLPLKSLLTDLSRRGESLVVELKSQSPCHGILFPVTDRSFCIHVVGVPPGRSDKLGSKLAPDGEGREIVAKSFDPTVLEDWYLPSASASSFLASFCHKEPPSQKRESLLDKLQKRYLPKYGSGKRDVRPKSDQVGKQPCASRTLRKTLSLNISSRSAGMVAHSYVNRKRTETSTSTGQKEVRQLQVPDAETHDSEAQLVERLKSLLESAASSELTSTVVTCAQNIVSVVRHHVDSKLNTDGNATSAEELLQKHFVKNSAEITQMYSDLKDASSRRRRLREYQFQVALALERELQFKTLPSACVETVLSLLRTMSFIYGPSTANQFLVGPIKEGYVISLREVLAEICEELDVPLFCDDSAPSDGTFSDIDPLSSIGSMTSHDSCMSSIPSVCSQRITDENRQTLRVDLSQPSATEKRQIVVPRVVKKGSDAAKQMRASPRAPAKKENANNVRRGLFVSPTKKLPDVMTQQKRLVLKTTFVPETPTHKQGERVVLRRQERLRKRSGVRVMVSVVEETPEKLLNSDESTTPRKSLGGVGGRSSGPSTSIAAKTTLRSRHPRGSLPCSAVTQKTANAEVDVVKSSPNAVAATKTPSKSLQDIADTFRTPTRPSVSTFSPARLNLEGTALLENIRATPRRQNTVKTTETPPNWNGSEALFVSPVTVSPGDSSESMPRRVVEFVATPRRRVSKRLLESPSTPKAKQTLDTTPPKFQTFNVNSLRLPFRVPSPEADVLKLSGSKSESPTPDEATSGEWEHAIGGSFHLEKRRSLRSHTRNEPSDSHGEHAMQSRMVRNVTLEQLKTEPAARTTIPLPLKADPVIPKLFKGRSRPKSPTQDTRTSRKLEHTVESTRKNSLHLEKRPNLRKRCKRDSPSDDRRENAVQNKAVGNSTPLTPSFEPGPAARVTRSKAKETGLTPYEIFLLSQASPVKGNDIINDAEDGRCKAALRTPRSAGLKKKMFTSPSALSVLHLTTSPVFLMD